MLTHLLTALLPSSHCFLLPTVSFYGQLSQADCSLLPSFVNWPSLSSLGPSFPPPLPVSHSGPLCGFRAKTDKEILWVAPTQTETNATHRVTQLMHKNTISSFLLIPKDTKLVGEIVSWRKNRDKFGTAKIYSLIFFLYSFIWPNLWFSIWEFLRVVLVLSWSPCPLLFL